ncbi:MAG: acyl-CoA dehydrogenase [Bacillota bacterium]
MKQNRDIEVFDQLINKHVKPFIRYIDEDAFYPKAFLSAVGKAGILYSSSNESKDVRERELYLIEKTAKYCMTSAFLLWCHLAALSSVRLSKNTFVQTDLLPLLESGDLLGATGLSNALKFYAGLEPVQLEAEKIDGGHIIRGSLPNVSNLDNDNWLVILASVSKEKRVMFIIPINSKGLELDSKRDFLGLNGSATYSCFFDNVFVPDKWIITEEADEFIQKVRPTLVLYQIPLGLGLSKASIKSIEESYCKSEELNQHLNPRSNELIRGLQDISSRTTEHAQYTNLSEIWKGILFTRLEVAKLTTRVVQADMLYTGRIAYTKGSDAFRRLREAYFLVNLSPTVRQLESLS